MNQNQYIRQFHDIPVPPELDHAIRHGVDRSGPFQKKRRLRNVCFKWMASAAMAAVFLTAGMNISTAFAKMVTERVPFLSALVIASQQDPGLKLALENGYVQQSSAEAIDNSISFAVHDVIADENKITLSYRVALVEGHDEFTNLIPRRIMIRYNGMEAPMDFTFDAKNDSFRTARHAEGVAVYSWKLKGQELPKEVVVAADQMDDYPLFLNKSGSDALSEADRESALYKAFNRAPYTAAGQWQVKIALDGIGGKPAKLFENIRADTPEGSVNIKRLEITPSQAFLLIDAGERVNTLLLSDELSVKASLADGNGQVYQARSVGVQDGLPAITLESSYFSSSNELSLVLSGSPNSGFKTQHIMISDR